jgi:MFS family permease
MTYICFLSTYRSLLAFGLLTALSSSFGQTFFISLFLPYFMVDFSLSKADVGFLYAGSTLLGAVCLPYLGGRIGELELRRYTALTIAGLAGAAFLVALAPHVLLLGVGILGLRLTGQGLLGHISHTVMAREFIGSRGKALGFAGLGYPLGEAVLPIACALALGFVPWRVVWVIVGAIALALVLPAALRLLRHPSGQPDSSVQEALRNGHDNLPPRKSFFRDVRLYLAMPATLMPSFVLTGMFLYQAPLSEAKGWAPEWMAAAFAGFAISRALSSLAIGPLIDRYSAIRLLPVYGLPLGLGLLLLQLSSSPWVGFPYLLLAGMTGGANGAISSAILAEMYGGSNIGRIRSFTSMLGVLSAAASPAVMGALFYYEVAFDAMLLGAAGLTVLTSLIGVPLLLRKANQPGGDATDQRGLRLFSRSRPLDELSGD